MRLEPKKRLGQNFLVDQNIQRKIVAACAFRTSDTVLEIGAGTGELTRLIAECAKKIYAIEIDANLCQILQDKFKGQVNVEIINQDILKFNLKRHFGKIKNKIKVVGNIPYYITTPIIEHLIKYWGQIDSIFITVQKEFAKRMVACSGSKDYGAFSCFVQYYTKPKILFLIKKTCFRPQPKVDSCLLQLEMRQEPPVATKNKKSLFKIIRRAFNQRRKTLRNSLRDIVTPKKLKTFFNKYGIDQNIRPEDLTLRDFANLSNI